MNRRRFLAGSSVLLAGSSGCIGFFSGELVDAPGDEVALSAGSGPGGWKQPAHDAQNSRFAPAVSGPKGDVEVDWTAFGDRPLSYPVADDSVVVAEIWGGETVVSLYQRDGSEEWSAPNGALLPPVLTEAGTFVIGDRLRMLASDDGHERWSHERDFVTSFEPIPQTSPTVSEGRIFVPTNDGVIALEMDSGDTAWETAVEAAPAEERTSWATPAVTVEYVYTMNRFSDGQVRTVQALQRSSGDPEWTSRLEFEDDRKLTGHVVAGHERVFITVRTIQTGLVSGSDESGDEPPGKLLALDATTGAIDWEWEYPGLPTTPPAYADGVLFVPMRDESGDVGALATIDAETGHPVWAYETDVGWVRNPAVTPDRVYVAQGDEVAAVFTEDGSVDWALDLDERVETPVVVDDRVYVLTGLPEDGTNGLVAIRSS